MNAEHRALAEYLENRLTTHMNRRFDQVRDEFQSEFKKVNRNIYNLTMHVDGKNDRQDDEIEDHAQRISALESDYRVLTS